MHQYSIASRPSPPNNSQTSQTRSTELQHQPLPTPRAHGLHDSPAHSVSRMTHTVAYHSPNTPPRVNATSSTNASPSLDAIRAIYRKYPKRLPQTPPQEFIIVPPNAPGGIVPPRYWSATSSTKPDSPTPDRPRSRPLTNSLAV